MVANPEFTDTGPSFSLSRVVQIHPYLAQEELVQMCQKNSIQVMAFCPLGSAWDRSPPMHGCKLMQHEIVTKAAAAVGKSPAQVLIRWGLQRGSSFLLAPVCLVLPPCLFLFVTLLLCSLHIRSGRYPLTLTLTLRTRSSLYPEELERLPVPAELRLPRLGAFRGRDGKPEYPR